MRSRTYVATPRSLAMMVLAAGAAPAQGRPTNGGEVMRATRARRALLGVALLVVLASPVSARADTVTDWNQIAAAALQSPGTATPPGAGQAAPPTLWGP